MGTRQQIVVFHPRHRDAVLAGEKTVTVRWGETIVPGPALVTFDDEGDEVVEAHVHAVEQVAIADLTPAAVHETDGTDMVEYVRLLRTRYYPPMPDDAVLDVVRLTLDRRDGAGSRPV